MSRAKQRSLFLFVAAGLFIVILAMSLPNLVLSPGQPFSLQESTPDTAPGSVASVTSQDAPTRFIQGILALALVLLPFSILYSIFDKEGRRRLIRYIVLIALILVAAEYLQNLPDNEREEETFQDAGALLDPVQMGTSDSVMDFPDEPPQWLTAAVILVMSILLVGSVGIIYRLVQQRRQSSEYVLEKLAEEVQQAIVAIHEGDDFKTTIIRCYQEMSRVIKAERGIARDTFMTPREFEHRLIDRGFSRESVTTLTRLFEQVRYSTIPTGAKEKHLALTSLTTIVDACKNLGSRHEVH